MTLAEALQKASAMLAAAGFENSRWQAKILAAHAAGCTPGQLLLSDIFSSGGSTLEESFFLLVQERLSGIPLQHVIGEWDFFGRTFKVDSRALIPRPETELLIEYILASELPPKPMILDVGTGSGIIGISLALEFPNSTVVGTDISLMAIELAEKNRKLLNASNYSACNCYLAEGIKAEFDLIAANLPYIPSGEILSLDSEVRDYDPVSALDGGTEGTLLILELVKSAPDLLTSGGLIVLETGYDQASSVPAMFSGGCWANVQTHKDLAGNHRMVTARRR